MKKILSALLLISIIFSMSACLQTGSNESITEPTGTPTEGATSNDPNVFVDPQPDILYVFENAEEYKILIEKAGQGRLLPL